MIVGENPAAWKRSAANSGRGGSRTSVFRAEISALPMVIGIIADTAASLAILIKLAKKRPFPADVMCVEHKALVGQRYGTIPFSNIIRYSLEDGEIKIRPKDGVFLVLRVILECRHRLDELFAAFELVISA